MEVDLSQVFLQRRPPSPPIACLHPCETQNQKPQISHIQFQVHGNCDTKNVCFKPLNLGATWYVKQ